MKVTRKSVIQYAILSVLFGIGFLAFMVLAGDDDPSNPLPFGQWLGIKLAAAAVIYLCVKVGKFLDSKGLIPDMDDPEID